MSLKENSDYTDISIFFTEAEQVIFFEKLWNLLKSQSEKYNGLDSTSLTIEKAQELLESLIYTIQVAIEEGVSKTEILEQDLNVFICRGQEIIRNKKKTAIINYELMLRDAPVIQNYFFVDTIRNLKMFFRRYELYYESHQIPCSIDYPLLCPVQESIKGISYIEEYIRRLQIENDFIRNFDKQLITRLYKEYSDDYINDYYNLCDPVITNAIGLEIISQDVKTLNITQYDRGKILSLIRHREVNEIQILIEKKIFDLCNKIGMEDSDEINYFIEAESGLSVRLFEAAKANDLSYVFLSFC